jgi:hypothetical protein
MTARDAMKTGSMWQLTPDLGNTSTIIHVVDRQHEPCDGSGNAVRKRVEHRILGMQRIALSQQPSNVKNTGHQRLSVQARDNTL